MKSRVYFSASAATAQSPGPITNEILRRNDFAGYEIFTQVSYQYGGLISPAHEKSTLVLPRQPEMHWSDRLFAPTLGRVFGEVVNGVRQRPRRQGLIGTLKDYPTKRLAQRALDERIAHVNKISYRPMPTAKFADFAQNWESKVLSQYGDSTAINYRTHIRKHLVPFFGEYSMKDLNPEMVQQFVSVSAVSAKTTKNICITLQSMWTTARAWGYVAHDLMEGVVLPEVKRVQRFFLSQREI